MTIPLTLAADQGHGTPPADVAMDSRLVRALLIDQHPDLADLPVSFASSGWDNWMFRLGEDLAIRLPRRAISVQLLEIEQSWLTKLAPRLPLQVPAPLRTGHPACGYPYPWSIVPWFKGLTASEAGVRADQAAALVGFLQALHQPAPMDAPQSDCRGVPLQTQNDLVEARLSSLKSTYPDLCEKVALVWDAALKADPNFTPTLIHGDLHPRNVVVTQHGELKAAIDWGDMCGGDVASDVAAFWLLLPTSASQDEAIRLYGAHTALVARAKGWAARMGLVLLSTGLADNAENARLGKMILERVTSG